MISFFFTVPPSPSNVDSTRLNGTHIQVTWERIPLTLSRGFIQTYIISYEKQNRRKRQVMTMTVSADVNSAIISGLDPTALYEVSVAATTAISTGNFSEGIISNRKLFVILVNMSFSFIIVLCSYCLRGQIAIEYLRATFKCVY